MAGKQSQGHKKVTLKIPAELYENLAKIIEGTGFSSVTEFAVWVLRDVAAGGKLEPTQPGLSQREIDIIRKRLQSLGYIE
jgi:hypothetical protein